MSLSRSVNTRLKCSCGSQLVSRRYVSADREKKAQEYFQRQDSNADSRVNTMRNLLFGHDKDPKRSRFAIDERRQAALEKVLPSMEVHETIESAFKILRRQVKQRRSNELRAKYASLRTALAELERLDGPNGKLFRAATDRAACSESIRAVATEDPAEEYEGTGAALSASGRIPGLFPRQQRVPTETAGAPFDEDWKRSQ